MIFNMVGGGGGSGATLVVSSPANVSVTVSKDDKSYTKNSGSLGSTTFKGLATGTWTVTISGNGQTATKTIEITADYAITIAFFSATINITYPANSNCVVTNSGGQTVASDTNTGSSTKTWTATVGATGTYTVTATATDGSGKSKSQSVSITADGQSESVKLSYALVLYDSGDECTDITGGWIATPKAPTSEAKPGNLSVTRGESSITITAPETGSQGGVFTPTNKIDLTSYSRLIFKGTLNNKTHDADYLKICIWSDLGTIWSNNLVASYRAPANTVTTNAEIDISSLTGEFVLGFALYNWSGNRPIVMMEDVFAE